MNPEAQALKERISELEEELIQLKERMSPVDNPFFGRFGLSAQLAAILWVLYRGDIVSNARLDAVTELHGRETRSDEGAHINLRTKVALCKLRSKLEPYEVAFETVWGVGYRLSPANKQRLKELIEKGTNQ